jgi:hypothetical protein
MNTLPAPIKPATAEEIAQIVARYASTGTGMFFRDYNGEVIREATEQEAYWYGLLKADRRTSSIPCYMFEGLGETGYTYLTQG